MIQALYYDIYSLQQNHNKGLHYGFRDAILSRLVTIIKRLVNHAVYCMSLSCLLSFLYIPYMPFLINEIFHLLVSFHFFLLLIAVTVIECNNNLLYIDNNINYNILLRYVWKQSDACINDSF